MLSMGLKRFLAKRMLAATVAVCLVLPSTGVMAEYLGLIAGREATPANTTDLSVEFGIVFGDLGTLDYQNIAARLNYRYTPELMISGTVGVSEFGDSDGVPIGLGLIYHLSKQRISQAVEIAAKASYHAGDYSVGSTDGDLSSTAFEVLVSGANPLAANGLSWYSNVGFHRMSIDFGSSDSANEPGLGAGLVLPTGLGEAYIGFEHIDQLTIGLGIRYFISN